MHYLTDSRAVTEFPLCRSCLPSESMYGLVKGNQILRRWKTLFYLRVLLPLPVAFTWIFRSSIHLSTHWISGELLCTSGTMSFKLDSQQSWTDTGLPLTKGKSHIRQVIASSTSVTGREGQSALDHGAGKLDLVRRVLEGSLRKPGLNWVWRSE